MLLGLRFIREVGPESARLIVSERQRGGLYSGVSGLVRRTGLKPKAVQSLVQAGVFDGVAPNRREALWDAGLATRPRRNGQAALPLPLDGGDPELQNFTPWEKMAGEYEVMGIYPQGHLMEFVRSRLGRGVLPTTSVYGMEEGAETLVAGWPIARQHPKGQDGTVFVTIEDEEGDVQLILWARVFFRHRRQFQSRVILARDTVSRWEGAASLVVSDLRAIDPSVPMPSAHDWH